MGVLQVDLRQSEHSLGEYFAGDRGQLVISDVQTLQSQISAAVDLREEDRELSRPEVSPEHVDLPQSADYEGQGVGTECGEVGAGEVKGFTFENTQVPGYEVQYEDKVLIVSGPNLL